MKRGLLAALLCVATSVFVLAGPALADPGGPNLQGQLTLVCDNGVSMVINPGTATNQGRVAWAVDSTSVFVASYFAVVDGDFIHVFFDHAFGRKNLTACTEDLGGGAMFVATGFFTPR
jgi:hypothetical protein